MRRSLPAWALPAAAMGALVAAGCSPPTTNDEVIPKTSQPVAQTSQSFSNYADYAKSQSQATAKSGPAGKGQAGAKSKSR